MIGEARHRGFTLLELMVVVAIIGVLATIAVLGISRTSYAGTPQMFAEQVAAQIDVARLRASARNRWQMVQVTTPGDRVVYFECTVTGMVDPTTTCGWNEVRTISAPLGVSVVATAPSPTATNPGDGSYTATQLHISPTGSGLPFNFAGATYFIRDNNDKKRVRVEVYPANVTAYAIANY